MKHTLSFIALLFTFTVRGQIAYLSDTVKIDEVIINGKKTGSSSAGYKTINLDSSVISLNSHASLADVLAGYSVVSVKSYGSGGIASPSFRGTGAGHTLVTWNGININNQMLGQSDLSLVPAGMIDDIRIYFGGASMALRSGGIGGIINLETRPEWNKDKSVSLSSGAGSFGSYSGLIKVKAGTNNFQTVTKAYFQSSENDFRYLNTEIASQPVWQTRKNSQVQQHGFIQEFYLRRSKNMVSARIWYQSANRNLPSSMLIQPPNSAEKQFDESIRTMLNYDLKYEKSSFFFTSAWQMNRLNYSNSLASIDSRNLSENLTLKGGGETSIGEQTKLKFFLTDELNAVRSVNYNKNTTRNTATLSLSGEQQFSERLSSVVLIREIFDMNRFLVPDFSAGLQFRLIDSRDYFIKANISRNSKLPTLNDMFWVPGGNPELKNEYAFIYELTFEMRRKISSQLIINCDLTAFRNKIRNMIQWHPGEYSFWTADNISRASSMGFETSASIGYSGSNITSEFNASYSYIKATGDGSDITNGSTAGRQLIYVPENQVNSSFRFAYRNIYSMWHANFTGRRYITVDNSRFLPEYILNSITTGIKLKLKGNSLDFNIKVDNLFNVNYQTIAYYPLPGRYYTIKLLFQLHK